VRDAEKKEQAKLEERQLLFAQINHDLRSPLNAIIGFNSLLRSELQEKNTQVTPDSLEFMTAVEDAGEKMLDIVNSVMDMAEGKAMQVPLVVRVFL
jgi:signal transduction histidine kinase